MHKRQKFTHLSAQKRVFIEIRLDDGFKLRAIARSLKRSVSTISREIKRNKCIAPSDNTAPTSPSARQTYLKGYCCNRSQARAQRLACVPRRKRLLLPGNALWQQVMQALRQRLSPMQVSLTLARMQQPVRISHESIYTALYAMPRGELRREVLNLLPWGHKSRLSRGSGQDRRRRGLITGMTSIEERPIEVDERLVPGHWEGDLIKGAKNRSQIGTLVERTTLFTVLVQVPQATAICTANAFVEVLKRIDAQKRLSLTYDQGKEMVHHTHLSRQTGMKVYFAHPHSPWERGINENTNGLLRRYFSKGTDLSIYTQQQLDEVAFMMNAKPRASLGGKCPAELFLPEGQFDFQLFWADKLSQPLSVAFGT
jgi:transposase, IS30 family